MKVVAEETWSWMLFEDASRLYLSVLCGTVALFERFIELTDEEREQYRQQGVSYIEQLAAAVAGAPQQFAARHLATPDALPGIDEAVRQWRGEQASRNPNSGK